MRFLLALVVAVALSAMPVEQVAACSCGFPGYPIAIEQADYAFVGTVIATDEPEEIVTGLDPASYAFEVVRSKRPMNSPVIVETTFGGGANCGFDMAIGEEWLVLATVQDGRPQTNLCQGTTTLAGLDPQAQRAVDAALAATEPDSSEAPPPATPEAAEPSAVQPSIVPAAAGRVLAVALGIILLFAIALVVRRRSAVS